MKGTTVNEGRKSSSLLGDSFLLSMSFRKVAYPQNNYHPPKFKPSCFVANSSAAKSLSDLCKEIIEAASAPLLIKKKVIYYWKLNFARLGHQVIIPIIMSIILAAVYIVLAYMPTTEQYKCFKIVLMNEHSPWLCA